MSDDRADKLLSHTKAWLDPLDTLKNAKSPKQNDTTTPASGIPAFEVRKKIFGMAPEESALPS